MFDPFKTTRKRVARKARRAASKAISDSFGAVFSPPPKRKPAKPKSAKPKAARPVAKRAAAEKPATSRSKATPPRGARLSRGTFESAFGKRSYILYVPAAARKTSDPMPLIVMLHGCGQSPADFARGTGMNVLAEEFGFIVLYPAQSRSAHLNLCWNWFRPEDQARDSGEPALLVGLVRQVIAEENVDPARVYAAGLSAGASAAAVLSRAYPDVFAAVGIHSGLAAGAARDAASATTAMQMGGTGQRHATQMPTIVFHGDADAVVNPRNGRFVTIRAAEPFSGLDRTERSGQVPGGKAYTRTTYRKGQGRPQVEHWVVKGSGHAWSGGHAAGSFTDPAGPDASREMVRFFLRHRTTKKRRAMAG